MQGTAVRHASELAAEGDMLSPRIMRWTDEEIEFEIVDPSNSGGSGSNGQAQPMPVQVRVENRLSNEATFLRPVPFFDALQGQPDWPALDPAGGEDFYLAKVQGLDGVSLQEISVTIGGRECASL